jgi:hypothetical protein
MRHLRTLVVTAVNHGRWPVRDTDRALREVAAAHLWPLLSSTSEVQDKAVDAFASLGSDLTLMRTPNREPVTLQPGAARRVLADPDRWPVSLVLAACETFGPDSLEALDARADRESWFTHAVSS